MKFWKYVTRLGVPGLALGVFYMIVVNLELTSAPPEWDGPLKLLTLFLAAAVTLYALKRSRSILPPGHIPKERVDVLNNTTWEGALTQMSRPETRVKMTLEVSGKEIGGHMECFYHDVGKQEFEVSGSFHGDSFLRLDYVNKDKATVQFGTCYFELNSLGDTLIGKCVGFGIKNEKIVTADFKLINE